MNSRGDEAGLVVAERFVIEALMGNSSRSAGFRARDRQTGKAVALSVIAPDRVESPEAMEWLMEVRRLSVVQHGAIAACFGYGRTAEGALYLATEWPEGEDLRQRMARRPLSTAESLKLARVLGEGLAELDRHAWCTATSSHVTWCCAGGRWGVPSLWGLVFCAGVLAGRR